MLNKNKLNSALSFLPYFAAGKDFCHEGRAGTIYRQSLTWRGRWMTFQFYDAVKVIIYSAETVLGFWTVHLFS